MRSWQGDVEGEAEEEGEREGREKGATVRKSQFGEKWWLWLADKRLCFSALPDRMGRPCLPPH